MPRLTEMKLQLLGAVTATSNGRPLPLGATKQRALLAMLALHANETVSVDRLVDGLWGDAPPATAPKMVQLYVSQLRRLFADADAEIVTQGRGYELRLDRDGVDVARFERLVEQAAGNEGAPNDAAREALKLWQGAPLADVADQPFAGSEVRRLEELRLKAAELAIDGDLALGREEEALAELERLIQDHPLRERLYAQRMLALYRAGRQAEALESYSAARRRLVQEAGIEPGAELRELQGRILRQDPSLRRPEPIPSVRPASGEGRKRESIEAEPGPAPRPRSLLTAALVVVVIAGAVFALTRLLGPDHLSGLDEDSVGVIDPTDAAITQQYRLGAGPGAVASGAGSVWVANPGEGTVSRLHRDDDRVETIDVGQTPDGIAFGGGSLWVAGSEDGNVLQVDPDANRVVQEIRVGNGLSGIAVGYGAVWATTALDGEVVRIDLRSGQVTERVAVGGHPVAAAAGAGAVWAAAEDAGTIVRVDPRAGEAVDAIAVGNGPAALAVGTDAVWSANREDGTVSRIDPETNRVTQTTDVGESPTALAIAEEALWVADGSGSVARLDPDGAGVGERVSTDSAPVGLVGFDGDVWVTTVAPPDSHRGGTLHLGAPDFELDPSTGNFPGGTTLLGLAYQGLVGQQRQPGAAGGRIVGELATEVPSPSDGGRRYTFQLRDGLTYSDGNPVRAGDFRESVERILVLTGPEIGIFDSIAGVDRCFQAGQRCDLSGAIRTNDESGTITIELTRPDPQFVEKLKYVPVVPGDTPRRDLHAAPPPGTGPYRIDEVAPGKSALFTRNEHFEAGATGTEEGIVDRIELEEIGDERAEARAVEEGRLDLAPVFDSATAKRLAALRTRFGSRLRSGAFAMTEYFSLNTAVPPFDDVRVRRALNLAVDRALVVDLTGGPEAGAPTCQLLPPGLPGYRPICPFTAAPSAAGAWTSPDFARAQRLVAASGAAGTAVEIAAAPPRVSGARHVAAVLERLGFPTTVRVYKDLGASLDATFGSKGRPQMGFNGWIADSSDSALFLRTLVGCDGDFNLSRFCDPTIDRAIDRAEAAGADAGEAWQRIEQRIAAEAPVVPLTTRRWVVVASSRLGNLQFHPFYGPLLDQVWVE